MMKKKEGIIERLGKEAQEDVIRFNIESVTHQEIADRLNQKYNSVVTARNVLDFLKRKNDKSVQMIKDDTGFQKELVAKYFNTITQLNGMNQEIYKLFFELRKNPELVNKTISCPHCRKSFSITIKNYASLLKTADVLLNQIRHVDAVLGKMSKRQLNVTYNMVDLSRKLTLVVPEILEKLEQRGMVKINRKKMKQIYN